MVLPELSTIIIALIVAVIYLFFKTFKSLIVNAIVRLLGKLGEKCDLFG